MLTKNQLGCILSFKLAEFIVLVVIYNIYIYCVYNQPLIIIFILIIRTKSLTWPKRTLFTSKRIYFISKICTFYSNKPRHCKKHCRNTISYTKLYLRPLLENPSQLFLKFCNQCSLWSDFTQWSNIFLARLLIFMADMTWITACHLVALKERHQSRLPSVYSKHVTTSSISLPEAFQCRSSRCSPAQCGVAEHFIVWTRHTKDLGD